MTFQAYLDSIRAKTGLGPDDFRRIAGEKGYLVDSVKVATIIDWLKSDYGLGSGHAMAVVGVLGKQKGSELGPEERLEKQFGGAKAAWRPTYDRLLAALRERGPVDEAATNTYISLLRGTAKFAVVAVTAERLDVGIKLKGAAATERFEESGAWNTMVTHRVRVTDASQVDAELLDWLGRAYDAAGGR
ncbi:MAG: hypothetical protein JWN36_391 [Microbacteriaceae bacterium]|nr:hypothetical protein [Microbacteriaceae bacterium]